MDGLTSAPEPKPCDTGRYLVGAMMCPLWADPKRWDPIRNHPDREPLLGWYDESDPRVADWEILWSLEHGISFFVACWYREKDNRGRAPIQDRFGHWVGHALPRSRYVDKFRYALMWENINPVASGVSGPSDFLDNVLPWMIDTHFRRRNYLRVDGVPLLFVHGPEQLAQELGGGPRAAEVLEKAREKCRRAGVGGLRLIGQNCTKKAMDIVPAMRQSGFEATFAYHWPTFAGRPFMVPDPEPDPMRMAAGQSLCWDEQSKGPLPHILTASVGWDSTPWGGAFAKVRWRLDPKQWRTLLGWAKTELDHRAASGDGIETRMLLLDNWNEYGEGHYLFPTKKDGFAWLDAVRDTFASQATTHRETVPAHRATSAQPQATNLPARSTLR
ncbi:MAG: glycoside hydrolase family 99-like domain-containing protein [Armatimonadaceae bacterium]